MKKVVNLIAGGLLILTLSVGVGVSLHANSAKEAQAIGNYSTDASTYYNGITATSGKQLAAQLHDLITSTHRYYTSYDDNGKYLYQQNTDQYYDASGNKVSGYLYEFYSGAKWSNSWVPNDTGGYNREHCWCQSLSVPANLSTSDDSNRLWGETGGGADMHHLRPVEKDLNSTRSNHPYGELSANRDNYKKYPKLSSGSYSTSLGGYMNGSEDIFEPIDSKKGDVARIILYTYLHYNSYQIADLFGSYGTTNGSGSSSYFATTSSGKLALTRVIKTSANTEAKALELLLKWNANDPVDVIEQRRNEQVAKYQGNRNPFIDNSAYADAIWGTQQSKTLSSISISGQTTSFTVGDSFSFGGTVTAHYSDLSTATVTSSSTFSGYNMNTEGNQTVTVSYTEGGVTRTTTYGITVNSSGGGGGDTPTGADPETFTMSSMGYSDATTVTTIDGDNCTITFSKGTGSNDPKYYNTGTAVRAYGGNTITISSQSTIIQVDFTFSSGEGSNAITSNPAGWESPTWSGSANSITFTIGGTSGHRRIASIKVTYASSGSTITSITASCSKTFYAGETITKSDITVLGDGSVNITDFIFNDDGYQFTYDDTDGGGATKSKTFVQTISYNNSLTADLTVNVERKAYEYRTDVLTRDLIGVTNTSYESWSDKSDATSAVYAGQSAGTMDNTSTSAHVESIQIRSNNNNSGIISTASAGKLSKITVSFNDYNYDGRTLNVYGKNTPYTSPTELYNSSTYGTLLGTIVLDKSTSLTSSLEISGDYAYIGICSAQYTAYLDQVIIDYVNDANNVANYIMYEDDPGQCEDKFEVAEGYFNSLSKAQRVEFMTSNNYVLDLASDRLVDWAKYHKKQIVLESGDYVIKQIRPIRIFDTQDGEDNTVMLIVIISALSLSAVAGYFFLKKKKHQ